MRKKTNEENLTRAERREQALDMMFGKDRKEYMGNIWGWRFSIMSLIGLLIVGGVAWYGIATGKINLDEQLQDIKAPSEEVKANNPLFQDSLNQK